MDKYVYSEIPELAAMAENPDLRNKLEGIDWAKLLTERPWLHGYCNWDLLDGGDWVVLLSGCPEFSDLCPWEKVCEEDWWNLLKSQPQFVDVCDWPWESAPGHSLANVFFSCYDNAISEELCPWDRLTGEQWSSCLSWIQWPSSDRYSLVLGDKCRWEKLNSRDWALLLSDGGLQYAFLCPWDKLDGRAWVHLLVNHPQLAGLCDWRKLVDELTADEWKELLDAQPQLACRCPDGIVSAYACASAQKPETTPSERNKVPASLVESIIRRLKERGRESLIAMEWMCLIKVRPEFADKCDWGKLDGRSWAKLLTARPEFADKCDWGKLDGYRWTELLETQPQFADKCDWGKLDGYNWRELLKVQPQFADKCDWGFFGSFGSFNWVSLLTDRPEFADKCDWGKLNGIHWAKLLAVHPEFANRCDWGKLSKWEWSYLVFSRPDMVFSFHLPNDEACEVIKAAWPLLAEYRHSSQS